MNEHLSRLNWIFFNSTDTSLTEEQKTAIQESIDVLCENLKTYFTEKNIDIDYTIESHILKVTRQA